MSREFYKSNQNRNRDAYACLKARGASRLYCCEDDRKAVRYFALKNSIREIRLDRRMHEYVVSVLTLGSFHGAECSGANDAIVGQLNDSLMRDAGAQFCEKLPGVSAASSRARTPGPRSASRV